jgi:ubiquinone/menaquinone biosynthesis C-methylase UbiE
MTTGNLQPENPFDDSDLAARYEDWYEGAGRQADILEKRLLAKLLADFPQAKSVLEVGCGTGHFTRWLAQQGLRAAGLDISEIMLAEARLRDSVEYVHGDAQALSFADRTWDLVALVTTLEFVPDPERALFEAVRVARHGLLLGVLNRWSLLTWNYRRSGKPLWNSAHFFTPGELKLLVRKVAEKRLRGIRWRTTLWPMPFIKDLPLPFGGFIGMAVHLAEELPL